MTLIPAMLLFLSRVISDKNFLRAELLKNAIVLKLLPV